MTIKLIIFDLDGTLVDSKKTWANIIFAALKRRGYNFTKQKIEKALGPKFEVTLKNLGVKEDSKLKREINIKMAKEAGKVKVCRDVRSVLQNLKREKIHLALLTNSRKGFVDRVLKKNNLDCFEKKFCGNFDIKENIIKSLARKYKLEMDEIIYVADKTKDVEIAKKVGCKIIIVLSCSWDKEIFKKRKDKFIIKNLSELIKKSNIIEK